MNKRKVQMYVTLYRGIEFEIDEDASYIQTSTTINYIRDLLTVDESKIEKYLESIMPKTYNFYITTGINELEEVVCEPEFTDEEMDAE